MPAEVQFQFPLTDIRRGYLAEIVGVQFDGLALPRFGQRDAEQRARFARRHELLCRLAMDDVRQLAACTVERHQHGSRRQPDVAGGFKSAALWRNARRIERGTLLRAQLHRRRVFIRQRLERDVIEQDARRRRFPGRRPDADSETAFVVAGRFAIDLPARLAVSLGPELGVETILPAGELHVYPAVACCDRGTAEVRVVTVRAAVSHAAGFVLRDGDRDKTRHQSPVEINDGRLSFERDDLEAGRRDEVGRRFAAVEPQLRVMRLRSDDLIGVIGRRAGFSDDAGARRFAPAGGVVLEIPSARHPKHGRRQQQQNDSRKFPDRLHSRATA